VSVFGLARINFTKVLKLQVRKHNSKAIHRLLMMYFVANTICAISLNSQSLGDPSNGVLYFAWAVTYLFDILGVYGLELCYIFRLQAFALEVSTRR
jgi:hypothetical protein